VGPRAGLVRCGKSRPHRASITGPFSAYPVTIPTELPGVTLVSILKQIEIRLIIQINPFSVRFIVVDVGYAGPSGSEV
jgi:hypothetical protein